MMYKVPSIQHQIYLFFLLFFKKIYEFIESNFRTIAFIYLFVVGCCFIHPINELIKDKIGAKIAYSYWILNENNKVAILTAFMCLLWMLVVLRKKYEDRYLTPYSFLFSLLGLSVVLFNDSLGWKYAAIKGCITFRELFAFIFISFLVLDLSRLIRFAKSYIRILQCRNKRRNRTNQLSMYTHYDDLKDQGWNTYINTIARRLLQADTSNESFAVGITGEWGSGKSTFLRLMKKRFEQEKCILIEFNPWRCTNSSMIIHDYFETLKEKLIPYYSDLEKPLTRYAETLVELELDNTVTKYAQKIVDREDTGLKSLQENIDACLVKMDLPVIIYIDDLDRLDKDELFEVLRLIRNTAQFKRLVYVVTYDKKHIVSLLKSKNIDSAELYIRKIFSMEISLPNYESDLLPQLLYEEIRRLTEGQLPNDMWPLISEQIFKQQENRYLIVEYLQTFRDIKRLAHSFAVNVESVFKLLYPIKEISIVDFFWLEVIHYADYDLYKMLKRESQQVFIIKSIEEKEGLLCYELTENYCRHRILHILYAKERLNDKDSIKYVVNHPKYFSFRLQKQQISKESYRMALNRESNFFTLEEWIKSQVNSNMVDRSQSLYFLLDKTDTQNLDIHISKRYIDLILYWLQYGIYNQIPILVSRKLKKECYNEEFHKLLASHSAARLETVIDQTKEDIIYYHISQALTFMYTSEIELEGNTQFSNDHLLSNEEIEAFHQRNIISYLQHAVIPIEDMMDENKSFYHLVRSAVVLMNNNQDTGYKLKKNLVIDFIIEHYRHNNFENDYKPFLKEFDSKTFSGDLPYLTAQMKSETKVKIEDTFGTLDKYKEFLEQCFLIPRNIRSNYYEKNNL